MAITSTYVSVTKANGLVGDTNVALLSRLKRDDTATLDEAVGQAHADAIDQFVAQTATAEYNWPAEPTASDDEFDDIQTAAATMWLDSMAMAPYLAAGAGTLDDRGTPVRELGHPKNPLKGETRLRQLLAQGGDTDADDGSPGGFEFIEHDPRPSCSSGDEFSSF